MPNINLSFAQDPNTLALALIYGMVPAVAWLFFWLREQRARPKGTGSLLYAFMAGALMVIAALPVEKFLGTFSTNVNTLTILWATAEEVLKFSAFLLMLFAGSSIEAPVDYAMYAVVVALGFAGFENALYFLQPLQTGDSVVLLLAGAMRFLGTTLMHAAAALKVPAVVIYGGFISPKVTGYPLHRNLFTGGTPCGMRTNCKHCRDAMAAILPTTVYDELKEILE